VSAARNVAVPKLYRNCRTAGPYSPRRTCVTRARLTPTRLASSARLATSPVFSIRCHSRTRSSPSCRPRPARRPCEGRPKFTRNAVNRFLFEELLGSPHSLDEIVRLRRQRTRRFLRATPGSRSQSARGRSRTGRRRTIPPLSRDGANAGERPGRYLAPRRTAPMSGSHSPMLSGS
jgi:hypothetical protein